jgi:hypothetical protein
MTPNMQPAEEGLKVDEVDEGGKGVTLNDPAADRDSSSGEWGRLVENDGGRCICIDVLDDGDGVWGEAEVMHDAEELLVINTGSIEGTVEINVESVDVAV